MAVTAPADKRFRRSHVKPSRKRSRLPSWKWRAVAAALALGAAIYAGQRAVAIVAGLDVFEVERITVRGNHRLSKGEVLALLEGFHGRSILQVDLRTGAARCAIHHGSPMRRCDGPSIHGGCCDSRTPSAGNGRINGVLYLIDDLGVAIASMGRYMRTSICDHRRSSSVTGDEKCQIGHARRSRAAHRCAAGRNMAGRFRKSTCATREMRFIAGRRSDAHRLGHERFVERISRISIAPGSSRAGPSIDTSICASRTSVREARKDARDTGRRKTAPKTRRSAAWASALGAGQGDYREYANRGDICRAGHRHLEWSRPSWPRRGRRQPEIIGIGVSEAKGIRRGASSTSKPPSSDQTRGRGSRIDGGRRGATRCTSRAPARTSRASTAAGVIAVAGKNARSRATMCGGRSTRRRPSRFRLDVRFERAAAGFRVDDQDGIGAPVGMTGARLEVNVHIVTGGSTATQNVVACVNRAGIHVVDTVIEQLAASEAVLTPDEKELGVALVDIGGGTTDIAIFERGSLWHTGVIGIGGDHFTNDIAVGLRTPIQTRRS